MSRPAPLAVKIYMVRRANADMNNAGLALLGSDAILWCQTLGPVFLYDPGICC